MWWIKCELTLAHWLGINGKDSNHFHLMDSFLIALPILFLGGGGVLSFHYSIGGACPPLATLSHSNASLNVIFCKFDMQPAWHIANSFWVVRNRNEMKMNVNKHNGKLGNKIRMPSMTYFWSVLYKIVTCIIIL